jgi:GAF domain-containing protein
MNGETSYLKGLCVVARAFGTTLDRKELLDLIVGTAVEAMRVKGVRLFLIDEMREEFVTVAYKGLSERYAQVGFSQPRHIACEIIPVMEKEGYFFSYDCTTDPRLENQGAKKAEGIASILVVPVRAKSRIIGGLSLFSATHRNFSPEEIDFASAIAEQGGIAIENARLFETLKRNTSLFLNLAVNINSSLDMKKILHIMTADIVEALDVKASSILLVDEEKRTLEFVASYGLSEAYLKRGPLSVEKSVDETLAGRPVAIREVAKDDRVQHKEEKMREGIVSILSAPIKTKEKVIGALRLYSSVPREFTEDEIMLVTALAHLGGLAIQNASMYLMIESDMKELKEELWSHRSWF